MKSNVLLAVMCGAAAGIVVTMLLSSEKGKVTGKKILAKAAGLATAIGKAQEIVQEALSVTQTEKAS